MLASPLMPTSTASFSPEDQLQYRPSRDLDSFNKLLPPPIEFVEGSSSGTLAVTEGTYEPINVSPKIQSTEVSTTRPQKPLKSPKPSIHHPPTSPTSAKTPTSLYQGGIDTSWPTTCSRGAGLRNTGNTCFLNSALQCLIHTPPLLRVLIAHRENCRIDKALFCMTCRLRLVAVKAHTTSDAFTPISITERLQTIAKHMKRGRQEDSHEFLRYAIDALQKSCLAGYPPKLDPKLAETTWVHKIFGGRLRSRVTCHDCGYNSDTFDRILDLSLDILRSDSLKDALRKFVAVDHLKGADKYKCEKCKKPVIAEKRFTIHEAPMVLTVHLKRFSPLGRKISHYVDYDDRLSLHPFMSEGQHGFSYSLYGVICHAGGGPNSGHYFAYVKDKDGRWWEMNDEMVSPVGGAPVSKKNAYILFYMRSKGQGLEAAVNFTTPTTTPPSHSKAAGLAASMKKRKEREMDRDDEDVGEKVTKPFIGPVIPNTVLSQRALENKTNGVDMQSVMLKKKIEAKAAGLLAGLDSYNSDEDAEEEEEEEERSKKVESTENAAEEEVPPTSPP
ncbi:Usp36 protein, partial [Amanita rubescens]